MEAVEGSVGGKQQKKDGKPRAPLTDPTTLEQLETVRPGCCVAILRLVWLSTHMTESSECLVRRDLGEGVCTAIHVITESIAARMFVHSEGNLTSERQPSIARSITTMGIMAQSSPKP